MDDTLLPSADWPGARVTLGLIEGDTILVEYRLDAPLPEGLTLDLTGADGSVTALPLPASAGTHRVGLPVEPGRVLLSILPVAHHRGQRAPLALEAGYALGRLLMRSETEVTQTLRWQRRIDHLDTRFFIARNSVAGNPGDLAILCRCLVSVGYTAIEQQRADILAWVEPLVASNWDRLLAEGNAQLRASVAIFAMHLAILREDHLRLTEIALQVPALLEGMAETPTGAANGLACQLLGGAFLLETGWPSAAVQLFRDYDTQFRIANDGFPRTLITLKELIGVAQRAYLCELGRLTALKRPLPARTPPLTLAQAWDRSSRLWDTGARDRLGAALQRMVAAARKV